MKSYRILEVTNGSGEKRYKVQRGYLGIIWITCWYWYKISKGEGCFTSNLYYWEVYHSLTEAKWVLEDKEKDQIDKSSNSTRVLLKTKI